MTLLLLVLLAQAPPPQTFCEVLTVDPPITRCYERSQNLPAPVVEAEQEHRAGWLHLAIAAHVVAQMVDVSTTEYGIGTGRFREANPAMRWAARSPVTMGIAKGSLAVASSWALLRLHKQHPKAALIGALVSSTISVAVSARNIRTISQKEHRP